MKVVLTPTGTERRLYRRGAPNRICKVTGQHCMTDVAGPEITEKSEMISSKERGPRATGDLASRGRSVPDGYTRDQWNNVCVCGFAFAEDDLWLLVGEPVFEHPDTKERIARHELDYSQVKIA